MTDELRIWNDPAPIAFIKRPSGDMLPVLLLDARHAVWAGPATGELVRRWPVEVAAGRWRLVAAPAEVTADAVFVAPVVDVELSLVDPDGPALVLFDLDPAGYDVPPSSCPADPHPGAAGPDADHLRTAAARVERTLAAMATTTDGLRDDLAKAADDDGTVRPDRPRHFPFVPVPDENDPHQRRWKCVIWPHKCLTA